MASVRILQIVGYKNSGKTTLMGQWISLLSSRGYSVASIKHHGHDGDLEMPVTSTDSMKFWRSGASSSIVSGSGTVQMHLKQEATLQQLKELAIYSLPDIILIEGFKQEKEPKVVMLRSEADWNELQSLSSIELIVANDDVNIPCPNLIKASDSASLDKWIMCFMAGDTV